MFLVFKKTVTVLVIVAMAATMATRAFASFHRDTPSEVTVAFYFPYQDGVYCPRDATLPPVMGLEYLEPLNLDFGMWSLPLVETTYHTSGGIVVLTQHDWIVNVGVSSFYRNETSREETLAGFELNLIPVMADRLNPKFIDTEAPRLSAGTSDRLATGRSGITGTNFSAELTVQGNTAHIGDAQATITWSLMPMLY